AMAELSPVMGAVRRFAAGGGPVIGICNGFQILLEAGLLPGAMIANESLKFICDYVYIRNETSSTPFTGEIPSNSVLRIPIAHYQGNYYADRETLASLEADGQVVFRYCDAAGNVSAEANPNGSVGNIAGICNAGRNVLGMMPHPERCSEEELGSADGTRLFTSMLRWLEAKGR
ncbi:MAG TPA: phosphoribosylformylglycinamidine synthase I, partial [Candidatus Limnocylindrales bacterium]|nr:phosphoribosylformylglycinamidine synthase I [Candidatus Limnocylindrales bacterium]